MVGWLHRLNGRESERTLGDRGRRETWRFCSLWSHRVDTTWRLNINSNENSFSQAIRVIANGRISY